MVYFIGYKCIRGSFIKRIRFTSYYIWSLKNSLHDEVFLWTQLSLIYLTNRTSTFSCFLFYFETIVGGATSVTYSSQLGPTFIEAKQQVIPQSGFCPVTLNLSSLESVWVRLLKLRNQDLKNVSDPWRPWCFLQVEARITNLRQS